MPLMLPPYADAAMCRAAAAFLPYQLRYAMMLLLTPVILMPPLLRLLILPRVTLLRFAATPALRYAAAIC